MTKPRAGELQLRCCDSDAAEIIDVLIGDYDINQTSTVLRVQARKCSIERFMPTAAGTQWRIVWS